MHLRSIMRLSRRAVPEFCILCRTSATSSGACCACMGPLCVLAADALIGLPLHIQPRIVPLLLEMCGYGLCVHGYR